eukprot:CAMPEP_0170610438 /NCGR_PEP_ID=MMETSP0224-20130122/22660_1 /TAXON_ID=285029 /ORGANISM="Togula jolla, Strain CCCM 725" /LENGTH=88 /DNA_ID=CAMNT_0010935815 /DNA_START=57 /DNA_END=321 /DNA_ORIENTATION=+
MEPFKGIEDPADPRRSRKALEGILTELRKEVERLDEDAWIFKKNPDSGLASMLYGLYGALHGQRGFRGSLMKLRGAGGPHPSERWNAW